MTEEIGTSNLLRTWANNGTVVIPANAKIDEGWLRGEQPPHEWMNYIHNVLGQKVNHTLSRGAPDWNDETEYLAGAVVNHSGSVWIATATNTNSEPSDGNTNWAALYSRDNIVGTVSQSGGEVDGAVFERDSSDDGQWTRFADGLQIMTRDADVDLTDSGEQTFDFPTQAGGPTQVYAALGWGGAPGSTLSGNGRAASRSYVSTNVSAQAWIVRCDGDGESTRPANLTAISYWY